MKKLIFVVLAATMLACSKVPISDRRQVNLVPSNLVENMGTETYLQYVQQHPVLATTDNRAEMVARVGNRIKTSVETYLRENKMSDRIEGYKWEFKLVEDPTANAFALPGGKVVVHTGILPLTQTETGLATVMSHEIAHVVARHGNERLSQGLLAELGGIGLAVALNDQPEVARSLFMNAYGIGSTLGILKYSRTHESEADKLGLIFMARAGYNPDEAVGFWERMAANSGGQSGPQFLSTHPSDETRIKDIKAYLPVARRHYKVAPLAGE